MRSLAETSEAAKRRFMRHGPEGPILAASHPSVQEGLPVRAGRCPRRQTGSLEEKRRRCGALQSLTREETFVSEAISDECECKITAFLAFGQ